MWSGSSTLATVLLDRPPETTGNTETIDNTATTNNTDASPTVRTRLIVYSADRFSDREQRSGSDEDRPPEEIVKRFPSGSVLVQIQEATDSKRVRRAR